MIVAILNFVSTSNFISIRSLSIYKLSMIPFVHKVFFFCVEVLQPSQPNGVMSSAVSLPNHTFTGQT